MKQYKILFEYCESFYNIIKYKNMSNSDAVILNSDL